MQGINDFSYGIFNYYYYLLIYFTDLRYNSPIVYITLYRLNEETYLG